MVFINNDGEYKVLENSIWKTRVAMRKYKMTKLNSTNSYVSKIKSKYVNYSYDIHDNGCRPFRLVANDQDLFVLKGQYINNEWIYEDVVYETKEYEGFWLGFDPSVHECHGTNILIKLNDSEYISVGGEVYKFVTNEKIVDYVAELGNSDVPYPVAIGEKNIYFILTKYVVPRDYFSFQIESVFDYERLYANLWGHGHFEKIEDKHHLVTFNSVTLEDRA